MTGLKPCPFCGATAYLGRKWCRKYWVRCDHFGKCEASVGAFTQEEAIRRWNRRVIE